MLNGLAFYGCLEFDMSKKVTEGIVNGDGLCPVTFHFSCSIDEAAFRQTNLSPV